MCDSTFSWHVGEDLLFRFKARTPTDISTWTILLTIFNSADDDIFNTTTFTILDADTGVFSIAVTSANTTSIGTAAVRLELRRTNAGSNKVIAKGNVEVE